MNIHTCSHPYHSFQKVARNPPFLSPPALLTPAREPSPGSTSSWWFSSSHPSRWPPQARRSGHTKLPGCQFQSCVWWLSIRKKSPNTPLHTRQLHLTWAGARFLQEYSGEGRERGSFHFLHTGVVCHWLVCGLFFPSRFKKIHIIKSVFMWKLVG